MPHQPAGWFAMTLVVILLLSCAMPVFAADGKVTYSGNAQKFIFAPGSNQSPTDLFPNFKDVMPGDTLTQTITVKSEVADQVKVKLYLRSLGAQAESTEFLSQLKLTVKAGEENTMAYMFDAAANETAQLTDWVYLGTLYAGGQVNLDVSLQVPASLDNKFQNQIGYLNWEFKTEEISAEPTDPMPPKTGDETPFGLLFGLMGGALIAVVALAVFWYKKSKENDDENQ